MLHNKKEIKIINPILTVGGARNGENVSTIGMKEEMNWWVKERKRKEMKENKNKRKNIERKMERKK